LPSSQQQYPQTPGLPRSPSRLAGSHGRARDRVVGEVVVDVDYVSWVRVLERAGDRHRRAQVGRPASSHCDLCTLDVELRDSRGPRVVNGQLLDTQEVFPVRDALREVERVCFYPSLVSP
jgi:hypothetical protein